MSFGNAFGSFAGGAANGYAMGKSIKDAQAVNDAERMKAASTPENPEIKPQETEEKKEPWSFLTSLLSAGGPMAANPGSSIVGQLAQGDPTKMGMAPSLAGKSIIGAGLKKLF